MVGRDGRRSTEDDCNEGRSDHDRCRLFVGSRRSDAEHAAPAGSADGAALKTALESLKESAVDEPFSIKAKTALVTGGGRGIGLMIVCGFVEAGVSVIISSRNASVCERVAGELSELGTCIAIPADLSSRDECIRLASAVTDHFGDLDILVNNAGAGWGAPVDDFPAEAWGKVIDLNLKSVFNLTQALLPALRKWATAQDPLLVINIGSVGGIHAPGNRAWGNETYSYLESKAAVHHMTKVLASRLSRDHITVNAIAPGPFATKMMEYTLSERTDAIAASSPLGRFGTDDDMAGTTIYLASRAGAYVTGVMLPVDGGIVTTM